MQGLGGLSPWRHGRVTPCAGSESEFTRETENETPDTESWTGVPKETLDMLPRCRHFKGVTLEPVDL